MQKRRKMYTPFFLSFMRKPNFKIEVQGPGGFVICTNLLYKIVLPIVI